MFSSQEDRAALIAACRVLEAALKLRSGERCVVFFDESAEDVAELLSAAAHESGLHLHLARIEIADQKSYTSNRDDLLADLEFLGGSQAVLTCLTDDIECSHFRQTLVNRCVADDRKVGHMPGVSKQILAEALNIDYERAEQECDDLAVILSVGRSAVLTTSAFTPLAGTVHGCLTFDLGGINRPSIVSSGVVPAGTWGNLPGGETFIAPIEGSANGTFIITGSFENRVLHPGEYVRLHFEDGCLKSIDGSDGIDEEFAALLEKWRISDPLNYSNLAELGIGVNEGIKALTGRALLDEKCSDTIHIALGANYGYGGTVRSNVHKDLITWHPTLTVDTHTVIAGGKRTYESAIWRENLESVEPATTFDSKTLIGRSAVIRGDTTDDGRLKVRRAVSSGRLCLYTIGDHSASKDLSLIYRLLPPAAFKIEFTELREKTASNLGWSSIKISRALTLLQKHGVITIS
jgi:leucyl aminopeptidase (aminopeptidase T)